MLIQKSIKLIVYRCYHPTRFESFVNSEEYQTRQIKVVYIQQFESFVNSEEYQTSAMIESIAAEFESFVNSEEYQTLENR